MNFKKINKLEQFFLLISVIIFIWSGINPLDRITWLMEVAPSIIGAVLIVFAWKNFRLSTWLLVCICVHSIILCIGGKYTYANVPIGFWIQDIFGFSRNHYDRIGHFAQGFFPAFLAREILLRNKIIPDNGWLKFITVSICLAFSAFYELIEFAAAILMGGSAEAFLGTQGDVWDTQTDMLMALIGALLALVFSNLHNQSIYKNMNSKNN